MYFLYNATLNSTTFTSWHSQGTKVATIYIMQLISLTSRAFLAVRLLYMTLDSLHNLAKPLSQSQILSPEAD